MTMFGIGIGLSSNWCWCCFWYWYYYWYLRCKGDKVEIQREKVMGMDIEHLCLNVELLKSSASK